MQDKPTPASFSSSSQQTGHQSKSQTSRIFDTHQITKMYDNGLLCDRSTQALEVPVPRPTYSDVDPHSISDILSRPVRVYKGTINNATTNITQFDMSTFNADPMIANKLSNFQYLRGDACYKLVLNAGIQSLGRLVIVSSPYETTIPLTLRINALTTVSQLTTYPHAEMDFGSGESLIFRVPYCARNSIAKMNDMNWSHVQIKMLNQFVGLTGPETCELTVYAWWENLHLYMPIAQSDVPDRYWSREEERFALKAAQNDAETEKPGSVYQADPVATGEAEMNSKTDKPISSALSKLSDFSYMFRFVPLVGPYIAGVSWLSGVASHVASSFGYSKPLNNSSTHFMSNMPMRGYTHCEGSDDSLSLSLRPSNRVSVCPSNFGVRKDPHSFHTFLTRDHIISQFQWTVVMPSDTIITSINLNPTATGQTLFRALSDYYQHYAASLIFRVSLIKNVFYSGRIAVQWFSNGVVPVAWNPGAPSIVLDVKTNDELVFRVPFMSHTRVVDFSDTMGALVFWVVNPLRVNGDYPQFVPINLSMCVDEAVLYSMPRDSVLAYAQGLPDNECVIPSPSSLARTAVDIYSLPPPTPNALAVVDGEFTNTISDLLKRYVYYFQFSTTFGCYFSPSYFGDNYTSPHPLKRFSNFYRFWRGSFRYKIMMLRPPSTPAGDVDDHSTILVKIGYSATLYPITPGAIITTLSGSLPETQVSENVNNIVEVSVPYYSVNDRSIIGVADGTPVPFIQIQISVSDPVYTDPPVFQVYAAAGEDFSFGFPCGMPKLS